MSAVFLRWCCSTGNTMAQAVRERIPELAVLKTIGFSNRSMLLLVLAESVLLMVLGGAVGLVLAGVAVRALTVSLGGSLPMLPRWRGLAARPGADAADRVHRRCVAGAAAACACRIVDALAGR